MKTLNSKKLLQFALAFVFLYAGIYMLKTPQDWVGFVPLWMEIGPITREMVLYANAIFEIILAVAVLSGKQQKLVGWTAAVHFLLITAVNGTSLLLITFRDIGLAFAAFAYAYLKE